MVMARKSLGDYMIEKGYATATEIDEAKKAQSTTKGDLAKILVDLGLSAKHVYESRAQEMGVPFVDLAVFKPDPSAINLVPAHVAKRHNVLPVKKDGNILYVAMADPNNITASDDLRLVSRCSVRGVLAAPDEIEDAIGRMYGGAMVEGVAGGKGGMNPMKGADLVDADAQSAMKEAMAQYAAKGDNASGADDDENDGIKAA